MRDAVAYAKALTGAEAPREDARLVDFDVIFLRNNPNAGGDEGDRFNPALDFGRRLKQLGVLVLNDPDGLSRAGSKMYLAGFPVELRPKTLITRSMERVRAFLRELDGPAIIKPLAGFGGKNVFYVARGQSANLQQMISTVRRAGYVIVQEYLPAVAKGDKRVLLLGGVPLEVGEPWPRTNGCAPRTISGTTCTSAASRRRTDFSEAERRICDLLRPRLVADGLYFVGVDLVGDKILEINVFAPGGIANINDLYEIDVGDRHHSRPGAQGRAALGLPRADPAARLHARLVSRGTFPRPKGASGPRGIEGGGSSSRSPPLGAFAGAWSAVDVVADHAPAKAACGGERRVEGWPWIPHVTTAMGARSRIERDYS